MRAWNYALKTSSPDLPQLGIHAVTARRVAAAGNFSASPRAKASTRSRAK
jgi:hypothetical protein